MIGIWPTLKDKETARRAARQGFWAALYLCTVTVALIVYSLLYHSLKNMTFLTLVEVIVFAVLAFGIYNLSRFAAVSALLLYIADQMSLWVYRGPQFPLVQLVISLMFINSIRGTYAVSAFDRGSKMKRLPVKPTGSHPPLPSSSPAAPPPDDWRSKI